MGKSKEEKNAKSKDEISKVEEKNLDAKKTSVTQTSRTDWGGICMLIILNFVAYYGVIGHFSTAVSTMKAETNELEGNLQERGRLC